MNDWQSREKALNPNQCYIVRAPAGSGKTAILVQRYLRLLALVSSPEEIIALTFTNKAASEMRNRVLGLLNWAKDLANLESNDRFEKLNFNLAKKALLQDQKQQWNLLKNPEILKIKTIDAYLADLSFILPFTSNEQTPTEQINFYAQKAAENTLNLSNPSLVNEKLLKAYQKLIANFGYKHDRLLDAIANLLTKREQWLMVDFDWESQDQAIKKIASNQLELLNTQLKQNYPQSLAILELSYAVAKSYKEEQAFKLWQEKSQNLFTDLNLANLAIIQDALKNIVVRRDKNQFIFRKRLTAREGLAANPDVDLCALVGIDAESIKNCNKQMTTLLNGQFSKDKELLRLINQVLILPTALTDQESLAALILILKYANAELELLFKEYRVIDFSAVALKVLDALNDSESANDFLFTLDCQIKHLLIDEFQDVSHLQFELFKRLTANWEQSNDHSGKGSDKSLFLVGDPMQSIYRFRKAEVSHFSTVENEQKLGNLKVKKLSLNTNFRSEAELVALNNQIFATGEKNLLFDAISSEKSIAASDEQKDNAKNQNIDRTIYQTIYPATLHHRLPKEQKRKTKQALIEKTIDRIESLLKRGEKQIVILTPKRSALKELYPLLEAAKISYSSSKVDLLMEQIEVIDLHSITRALFDFNDQIAWLSLLRGVYCSLDLDDLIAVQKIAQSNQIPIYQLLENQLSNNGLSFLSPLSRSKIFQLIALINNQINSVTPLAHKVLAIHQSFELDFYHPEQVKNCNQYLLMLQNINPMNSDEFALFDHSLKNQYLSSGEEQKLSIMTIHNAKGLEFDHVICFDLINTSGNQNKDALLSDTINSYPIVAINDYQESGVFHWLNQISIQKQKNERIRLNYVALTRAKKSNFVVLMNQPNNDRFFQSLIAATHSEEIELKESFDQEKNQNDHPAKEKLIERYQFLTSDQADKNSQGNLNHLSNDRSNQGIKSSTEHYHFIHNRKQPAQIKLESEKDSIDSVIEEQNKEQNKEQKTPRYQWAGLAARSIGLLSHLFLEQIANQGLEAWNEEKINQLDATIDWHYKKLNGLDITEIERENVKKILKNTISCKYAKFIFSQYPSSENEFKINCIERGELKKMVVDRTFIDQNSIRWIIDYKTSFHQGGGLEQFLEEEKKRYQPQLNQYARAIAKMENNPIKLGLYFPLHQQLITWDWAN